MVVDKVVTVLLERCICKLNMEKNFKKTTNKYLTTSYILKLSTFSYCFSEELMLSFFSKSIENTFG